MIRVNLLPTLDSVEQAPVPVYAGVAVVGIGLLVVGGWYWILSTEQTDKQQRVNDLQQTRQSLQSILNEIEEFKSTKETLEARIAVIENLRDNQSGPVELMNVVIASIPNDPPGLWLASLVQRGATVTIEGRAFRVPFIADFIAALNNNPLFRFVELQFWEEDQPGNIRFQLNCQVEGGEEE